MQVPRTAFLLLSSLLLVCFLSFVWVLMASAPCCMRFGETGWKGWDPCALLLLRGQQPKLLCLIDCANKNQEISAVSPLCLPLLFPFLPCLPLWKGSFVWALRVSVSVTPSERNRSLGYRNWFCISLSWFFTCHCIWNNRMHLKR